MFIVSKNKNHRFCLNLQKIEYIRYTKYRDNESWYIQVGFTTEGEKPHKCIKFDFDNESKAQDAFNEMLDLLMIIKR